MRSNARGNLINLFLASLFIIGLIVLVGAADPTWKEEAYNVSHYFDEDSVYFYNFTANLTDYSQLQHFSVLDIFWSENGSKTSHSDFGWLSWDDTGFSNSTIGIMNINSTLNNQTGNFTINVFAQGITTGQSAKFVFIINATNDAPVFAGMKNEYNLTQDSNFLEYLNATDEESHYPLVFNITFFGNCTHASWSGRAEDENCSILSSTNFSNTSAIMNFTPERNDVGTYWANITVMDFGNSSEYGCPHEYCTPETYNLNQTTLYSSVVVFNVLGILTVNISDCQDKIFQENESGACQINITTRGQSDLLNITSLAGLRGYTGGVLNESWFFSNLSTFAENFSKSVTINFTPQKTEIGNWTIDFTIEDVTSGESNTTQIYVYVNKSVALDDVPDLLSIENVNTSIELLTTISLTVYDDDLKIPHKDINYGGYNETINFNLTILNASNLSQEMSLSDFEIDIISMPVLSGGVPTNKTTAQIQFTPIASDNGNYTINLTVKDLNNATDTETFNLLIISNSFPYWISPLQNNYSAVEGGNLSINLSSMVFDEDSDTLTFSNWSSTTFPAFFLNTTSGEINISNIQDEDVGQHIINLTVSDGYLTNTTIFNFTINNTNEAPFLETPLTVSGITINLTSGNMNTSEDVLSVITLYIQDDDFKVPANQKIFYNETLIVNVTINGTNTNLFNFTFDSIDPFGTGQTNRSKYTATFTSVKADVGNYSISINISDKGNLSDFVSFNLTITSVQHNPSMVAKDDLDSSIEESILVDFNATDEEDGTDANGSFIFSVNFVSGDDFINGDETIFNTTSGYLNMTFNSSLAGIYSLNISVNDSTGRQDSILWGLTVYDYPVFLSPVNSYVFSLIENINSYLNFSANHTVQDTLTYNLYIDGVLRNTTTDNGDGNSFLFAFAPNFTDETCTGTIDLRLTAFNSKLSNSSIWSLQIAHSNAPLTFLGEADDENSLNIGGSDNIESVAGSFTINLADKFSDIDATDSCINQTIGFSTTLINGSSLITYTITNWTSSDGSPSAVYTNPTSSSLTANYSLIAQEYNITSGAIFNTVSANNFTLEISPVSTIVVSAPSSGGGGGGSRTTQPISLKIIVPEPVSSRRKDRLVLPISLENSGKVDLKSIYLKAGVSKDGLFREDIIASFDNSIIDLLKAGAKKDLTLIVDANTEEYGLYEITLNATVKDPVYSDWAKIFINVEETESILERILFTEEFVTGNPECVELTELVDEARSFLNAGAVDESFDKLDEALEACRIAIEQPPYVRVRNQFEKYLFNYVWIVSVIIFMAGFLYYSYRRRKLKRGLKEVKNSFDKNTERFNNKRKLVEV
ncbi:MAG: hypothetical protein ABFQ65_01445 [Nanoarchaeota archaeon]